MAGKGESQKSRTSASGKICFSLHYTPTRRKLQRAKFLSLFIFTISILDFSFFPPTTRQCRLTTTKFSHFHGCSAAFHLSCFCCYLILASAMKSNGTTRVLLCEWKMGLFCLVVSALQCSHFMIIDISGWQLENSFSGRWTRHAMGKFPHDIKSSSSLSAQCVGTEKNILKNHHLMTRVKSRTKLNGRGIKVVVESVQLFFFFYFTSFHLALPFHTIFIHPIFKSRAHSSLRIHFLNVSEKFNKLFSS